MAVIRTIKPEFFTSPDTAKASPEARLLFLALVCLANNDGIGETNLHIILGTAFPETDEVSKERLIELLREVHVAWGVPFYTVSEGSSADPSGVSTGVSARFYYQILSFSAHQRVQKRATRVFPTYREGCTPPDQRIFYDGNFLRIPEREKEREREREHGKGKGTNARDGSAAAGSPGDRHREEFEAWWRCYPKKSSKQYAARCFEKAIKKTTIDCLISKAKEYDLSKTGDDRKFFKDPSTWLNQECWLDEPVEIRPRANLTDKLAERARIIQESNSSRGDVFEEFKQLG